jgi:hypothetical protein
LRKDGVKTILELPDALFRRAMPAAAQRGIALGELVSEALAEKLMAHGTEERPWMKSFGTLRALPLRLADEERY